MFSAFFQFHDKTPIKGSSLGTELTPKRSKHLGLSMNSLGPP
jgi:hypothetical protein